MPCVVELYWLICCWAAWDRFARAREFAGGADFPGGSAADFAALAVTGAGFVDFVAPEIVFPDIAGEATVRGRCVRLHCCHSWLDSSAESAFRLLFRYHRSNDPCVQGGFQALRSSLRWWCCFCEMPLSFCCTFCQVVITKHTVFGKKEEEREISLPSPFFSWSEKTAGRKFF